MQKIIERVSRCRPVNHGPNRSLLTVRERVSLHLLLQNRFALDSDSPKTVTQEGVAKAVEVGRNNVAKVLAEMGRDGVLDTFTKHVKGLLSVRKVYFLTPKGLDEAKTIKQELESSEVEVIDLKRGTPSTRRRLGNYLPKRYDLRAAERILQGVLDCRTFQREQAEGGEALRGLHR